MSLNLKFSPPLSKTGHYFEQDFLKEKVKSFKKIIDDPQYGFFHSTSDAKLLNDCRRVYEKFKDRTQFVHVGIGGSSLGPEMLLSAFPAVNGRTFTFINNIDPDELHHQLRLVDHTKALFYFVSKSGGTAETMAALAIITNTLEERGISKKDLKNYFVFATDPKKSQLLDLGRELHIETLEVPSNIGGRYSVLTPVGFLPALFAEINCERLLEGANKIKEQLLTENVEKNILVQTASFLADLKTSKNIVQTVMMPYSSHLKNFSAWFAQLWAESLGKKNSKSGKKINTGLTPIPAYGATDQHSQVQLFMEGPYDKVLLIIEIEKFNHDYSLKNSYAQDSLVKLSSHTLNKLMRAELHGTLKALTEEARPFIHIPLDRKTELELGALILFFESLTALMGDYLDVDPFDQPGVEAGKKYAFEWLSK